MSTAIFPTRSQATKAAKATHVSGASKHVHRIHHDNSPDDRTGWAVSKEDWSTTGVSLWLQDDGSWGMFA